MSLDIQQMLDPKANPLSEFYLSPDKSLSYLNIPKNASTSIKKALESAGWYKTIEPSDAPMFVVVRNPVDRYVSALAEWHRQNHTGSFSNWFNNVNHIIVPDEHAVPQIDYVLPFIARVEHIIKMERLHEIEALTGVPITHESNKTDYPDDLEIPRQLIEMYYRYDKYLYEENL